MPFKMHLSLLEKKIDVRDDGNQTVNEIDSPPSWFVIQNLIHSTPPCFLRFKSINFISVSMSEISLLKFDQPQFLKTFQKNNQIVLKLTFSSAILLRRSSKESSAHFWATSSLSVMRMLSK